MTKDIIMDKEMVNECEELGKGYVDPLSSRISLTTSEWLIHNLTIVAILYFQPLQVDF